MTPADVVTSSRASPDSTAIAWRSALLATAVFGAALAAMVDCLAAAFLSPEVPNLSGLLPLSAFAAGSGGAAALILATAMLAGMHLGSRKPTGPGPRRLSPILLGAFVALGLGIGATRVLTRTTLARCDSVPLRVGLWALAALVGIGAMSVLAAAANRRLGRGWQRIFRLGAVVAILALVIADRWVERHRQANAHLVLWASAFGCIFFLRLTSLAKPRWRPRLVSVALVGAGLVGMAGAAWMVASPRTRYDLLHESQWSRLPLAKLQLFERELPPRSAVAPIPLPPLSGELRAKLDLIAPKRSEWSWLFLGIDALPDRLIGDEYLTPNLSALAREAAHFRNAWTTYPSTDRAFASLFMGLPVERLVPSYRSESDAVAEGPTFTSLLAERGFATGVVTGLPTARLTLHYRHSIRGFDTVNPDESDREANRGHLDAPGVTRELLRIFEAAGSKSALVWAHYFDPHAPYEPKSASALRGSAKERYLAEVRETDAEVGRLLAALRARGLLDRLAIVVLSDHGESFGEHGEFFHGGSLYETQLNVPLILRLPGIAGRVVEDPVDFTALYATVLDVVKIPYPPHLRTPSLVPRILGAPPPSPPVAVAELADPLRVVPARQFAITDGRWKLIHDVPSGRAMLFDLSLDPSELHDIAHRHPEMVRDLELRLRHRRSGEAEFESHSRLSNR